jgi:hypothetical protein
MENAADSLKNITRRLPTEGSLSPQQLVEFINNLANRIERLEKKISE